MKFCKGSRGRFKGSAKFVIKQQRFEKACSTTVIYDLYMRSSQGFLLLVEGALYEVFIRVPSDIIRVLEGFKRLV